MDAGELFNNRLNINTEADNLDVAGGNMFGELKPMMLGGYTKKSVDTYVQYTTDYLNTIKMQL